jgi:hypothetical protein
MRAKVVAGAGLLLLGCSTGGAAGPDAGGTDAGADTAAQADVGAADAGGLVTVPLAACNPTVYSAGVTIGSQSFALVLDTGSTTLAVAGAGCASCADAGASPLYAPGPSAVDQDAAASATYGAVASSGWQGEIVQDAVTVGSPAVSARVDLVDIQQQTLFLVGACGSAAAPPDGVLGMAPSKTAIAGTDGLFDRLVAGAGVTDIFAVRLCDSGGTLWLGGYDPTATTAPPVFTPMAPAGFDAYVYTVLLASIAVAGTTVPVPTGSYTAALLDTGSSISWVPPAAFDALTTAITGSSSFQQAFGASASTFFADPNQCVTLAQTKAALDAALPPLTLTFGAAPGVSVQASATESYLLTHGGGQWCPAITARTPDPSFQSIAASLSAPILKSNVVIFDRANQRVGFAPHAACP